MCRDCPTAEEKVPTPLHWDCFKSSELLPRLCHVEEQHGGSANDLMNKGVGYGCPHSHFRAEGTGYPVLPDADVSGSSSSSSLSWQVAKLHPREATGD